MRHPMIDHVWVNQYGALCIIGAIGLRQYYEYTKKEAMRKYREEVRELLIIEKR